MTSEHPLRPPTAPKSLFNEIIGMIGEGELGKAEGRCRAALQRFPRDVNLLGLLGALLVKMERRDAAEATLRDVCASGVCSPHEVSVWLGACIGPRRFEVGSDVLEAFGAADDTSVAACFAPLRPGKWLADLPRLARLRLTAAGVHHISGGSWCTVEDASRFFSFRRDGVTGRMAAAVWIARGGDRRIP